MNPVGTSRHEKEEEEKKENDISVAVATGSLVVVVESRRFSTAQPTRIVPVELNNTQGSVDSNDNVGSKTI